MTRFDWLGLAWTGFDHQSASEAIPTNFFGLTWSGPPDQVRFATISGDLFSECLLSAVSISALPRGYVKEPVAPAPARRPKIHHRAPAVPVSSPGGPAATPDPRSETPDSIRPSGATLPPFRSLSRYRVTKTPFLSGKVQISALCFPNFCFCSVRYALLFPKNLSPGRASAAATPIINR